MRPIQALFPVCLSLFAPSFGCVVGVPPATLQAAAGARNVDGVAADATSLRAGIAPLGLVQSLEHRRVDVLAGYQRDSGRASPDGVGAITHSASLAFGAYPYLGRGDMGAFSRVGVFGQGRMLWDDATRTQGWGSAVQLSAELGTFMSDRSVRHYDWEAVEEPCPPYPPNHATWGVRGEASLGVFAEAGYARLGPLDIWSTMFGVSLRLPAVGYATVANGPVLRRRCCCR